MVHVIEHLPDPLSILSALRKSLTRDGRLIVETPNADDALLTRYQCKAFSEFTYWSCHLFLYNCLTLTTLLGKAGYAVEETRQFQRYPCANHLYWLAHGKPAGQEQWLDLVDPGLDAAYARVLADQGQCDTIIGIFTPNN
jgi:hypothetical protein